MLNVKSEPKTAKFAIYPNPANNNFNIQFKEVPTKEYLVSIIDMKGNQIYNERINKPKKNHIIDAKLNKGLYVICITVSGNTYTDKVIIN